MAALDVILDVVHSATYLEALSINIEPQPRGEYLSSKIERGVNFLARLDSQPHNLSRVSLSLTEDFRVMSDNLDPIPILRRLDERNVPHLALMRFLDEFDTEFFETIAFVLAPKPN